jgi:hypothetical protein
MDTNIITNATPGCRITETELCGWLGVAAPGDSLVYYRGHLAIDRDPTAGRLPERDRKQLLKVVRRAVFVAEKELAHLVQRRNGPNDFSYILIARPRPKTERGSILAILAEEIA